MLEKKISKSITQKEILICKVTLMQDAKSTKKSTKQQEDKQGCLTWNTESVREIRWDIFHMEYSFNRCKFQVSSTNVLYWIYGRGGEFHPFMANKLEKYKPYMPASMRIYIETQEICSCGMSIKDSYDKRILVEWTTIYFLTENKWPQVKIKEGWKVRTLKRKTFQLPQTWFRLLSC